MWEGTWVSACVCAICFCLSFLCLPLCQSRDFMAGDYQRWFWVQSWIISFCVWYKRLGWYECVRMCQCVFHVFLHPADVHLKKKKMSDVCVLIPAYQSTCGRAHCETELSISLHVGLKAVRSDPTPQPAIQPAATFVLWQWLSPDIIPGPLNNSG